MAEVTVEVAGAGDSRVKLQFLPLEEARALRSEVLARAAGLRHDVGEAPEIPITSVTPRDLALSLVMRTVTAALLLLTALIVVVTVLSSGWGGLGIALVTGGLPIIIVFAEFIKYFNFTVTQSPDGLRLKFGLAKTETRTVPPGRVQAIEIVEPLLWRRQGWVRVRVNIAGVGGDDSSGNKEETLLIPVATHEVAAGPDPAGASRPVTRDDALGVGAVAQPTEVAHPVGPAGCRLGRRGVRRTQRPDHASGVGHPARTDAVRAAHPGALGARARPGQRARRLDARSGEGDGPSPRRPDRATRRGRAGRAGGTGPVDRPVHPVGGRSVVGADQRVAASSSAMASANAVTSSSVVSQEHIQRTSPVAWSHV